MVSFVHPKQTVSVLVHCMYSESGGDGGGADRLQQLSGGDQAVDQVAQEAQLDSPGICSVRNRAGYSWHVGAKELRLFSFSFFKKTCSA